MSETHKLRWNADWDHINFNQLRHEANWMHSLREAFPRNSLDLARKEFYLNAFSDAERQLQEQEETLAHLRACYTLSAWSHQNLKAQTMKAIENLDDEAQGHLVDQAKENLKEAEKSLGHLHTQALKEWSQVASRAASSNRYGAVTKASTDRQSELGPKETTGVLQLLTYREEGLRLSPVEDLILNKFIAGESLTTDECKSLVEVTKSTGYLRREGLLSEILQRVTHAVEKRSMNEENLREATLVLWSLYDELNIASPWTPGVVSIIHGMRRGRLTELENGKHADEYQALRKAQEQKQLQLRDRKVFTVLRSRSLHLMTADERRMFEILGRDPRINPRLKENSLHHLYEHAEDRGLEDVLENYHKAYEFARTISSQVASISQGSNFPLVDKVKIMSEKLMRDPKLSQLDDEELSVLQNLQHHEIVNLAIINTLSGQPSDSGKESRAGKIERLLKQAHDRRALRISTDGLRSIYKLMKQQEEENSLDLRQMKIHLRDMETVRKAFKRIVREKLPDRLSPVNDEERSSEDLHFMLLRRTSEFLQRQLNIKPREWSGWEPWVP